MYPLTNKVIVLDLDETLVNSHESLDELKGLDIASLGNRFYSLFLAPEHYHVWGLMRPGCREFLSFCFDYFDRVIVWSAGKAEYVKAVVDRIFDGLPEPDGVFSRQFCEMEGGNTTKPLVKLQPYFPEVNLANTLIIDDREHNFLTCNPNNAILIPAFEKDDQALYQVMEWLLKPEVRYASDVRRLDKTHIFSKPLPKVPYSLSFRTKMVPTMAVLRA